MPLDIAHITIIRNEEFYELEKLGFNELKNSIFIFVAVGLGERLGYNGIIIGFHTELLTLKYYIELYIKSIKAYEDRVKKVEKVSLD